MAPEVFARIPVTVNGKKRWIIASETVYLPQFQRPDNRYTAFVCGNILNGEKTLHATPGAARNAAWDLAKKLDGAFFPTWDGEPPYL